MIKLFMKCSNIKVEADVSKLLVSYDQKSTTQKNSIDNDVKLRKTTNPYIWEGDHVQHFRSIND